MPSTTTSSSFKMKVVLVSGGVISGVGKGIIASSAGLLLKTLGLRVTALKIDPYLNVDAGTLGPVEHGEVFVLADGSETDLDLGNYERYLGVRLSSESNMTTGKIYQHVINRERRGEYLGKTVQVVPHVTDAIQEGIERVARVPVDDSGELPDVCVVELGGTVGDLESGPFIEALVQLRHRLGPGNFFGIAVSHVPIVNNEAKTKPTQNAVRQMRSAGLIVDMIACRCECDLNAATIKKVVESCQLQEDQVIGVHDMETIYQVPLLLENQGLLRLLRSGLQLDQIAIPASIAQEGQALWTKWKLEVATSPKHLTAVNVVLVGKYTSCTDAYLSVQKSLEHAAMRCDRKLCLSLVDSEHLEVGMQQKEPTKFHNAWKALCEAEGIIVPGGFSIRGVDGMMEAARYARERKIPFLGICLGFQVAVMEFARNVMGISDAISEEMSPGAENKVIIFMPEGSKEQMGGTMRLGTRSLHFRPGTDWSKLRAMYGGAEVVTERHRHRYEVNPEYIERLQEAGLSLTSLDSRGERVETLEIEGHPFFVGLQAHPEFTSKVLNPAPAMLGFVAASAAMFDEVAAAVKKKSVVNGNTTVALF